MEAIDPGDVARIGGRSVILTLSPPTRSKPAFWTLCHDGRRATVQAVEVEPETELVERLTKAWLEAKPHNFDSDGVFTVTWLEP